MSEDLSQEPQLNAEGSYDPSPYCLGNWISAKTDYAAQEYATKYTGSKPILVVCTDESGMEMANKKVFNTGNHPVEMLVPMLHFRDTGFSFDIATRNGESVKLEMWAYPKEDENVKNLHDEVKAMMEKPKKVADITSLDGYSAVFIPGGHGCMINLPSCVELGTLLHMAHKEGMPTVTLCHGPATLLSTCAKGSGKDFAYDGYKMHCYTDKSDSWSPSVGYLPGEMPWKCEETLNNNGATVTNETETGAVTQDRELISGDSPTAAHNVGVFAAPILVEYAMKNKL